MPSPQDCAQRLREQAYRTILPLINGLEQELQSLTSSLSAGVQQIGWKLDAFRNIELPATEAILAELLENLARQKDLEISSLALYARNLRKKETQEEILAFLLDEAHKFAPRVALFAVRGDRLAGWSSRGYSEAAAGEINSCNCLRSELTQLQEALEGLATTVQDLTDSYGPLQALQAETQGPWHFLPLCVMQRPVALLTAGGGIPVCLDALSILVELTSQRLENIALKILYELTAPRPETPLQSERIAETEAVEAHEPFAESAGLTFAGPPMAPIEQDLTLADLAIELEDIEMPAPAVEPAAAAHEIPAIEPEIKHEIAAGPDRTAETQTKDVLQIAEEEKLHADAKRFARLLVSEIKLYNEHHILEGREKRDLYLRLKRDIDRSREMYEKRVSPFVSRKIDYFHDEIIRILGDNDASTLGSDYPGPRVES